MIATTLHFQAVELADKSTLNRDLISRVARLEQKNRFLFKKFIDALGQVVEWESRLASTVATTDAGTVVVSNRGGGEGGLKQQSP